MELLRKTAAITALTAAGTLAVLGFDNITTGEMTESTLSCYESSESIERSSVCAEDVTGNYATQGQTLAMLELLGTLGVAAGLVGVGIAFADQRRSEQRSSDRGFGGEI